MTWKADGSPISAAKELWRTSKARRSLDLESHGPTGRAAAMSRATDDTGAAGVDDAATQPVVAGDRAAAAAASHPIASAEAGAVGVLTAATPGVTGDRAAAAARTKFVDCVGFALLVQRPRLEHL